MIASHYNSPRCFNRTFWFPLRLEDVQAKDDLRRYTLPIMVSAILFVAYNGVVLFILFSNGLLQQIHLLGLRAAVTSLVQVHTTYARFLVMAIGIMECSPMIVFIGLMRLQDRRKRQRGFSVEGTSERLRA